MKKFTIAASLIIASAFSYTAQAQASIGYTLKGGLVNSNWRGDGMNIFSSIEDLVGSQYFHQSSMSSYYAGIGASIPLTSAFSIEPGLQYSRVGASLQGKLDIQSLKLLGIRADARAISQRVELPVLLKAEIIKGVYLVAGPQANYAFDNKVQVRAGALGINLFNRKYDINNSVEPMSVSAIGGLQLQFGKGFQLQALYEYGLSKIAKDGRADIYQNSIRAGLGIPLSFISK